MTQTTITQGFLDHDIFKIVSQIATEKGVKAYVIGGGTIYRQMLPLCDRAVVTKVHVTPESDTWFPNLDEDPNWDLTEVVQKGEENGIAYEMCIYTRKGTV